MMSVEIDEEYNNCLAPTDRVATVGNSPDISASLEQSIWKAKQIATFSIIFIVFASINILCALVTAVYYICWKCQGDDDEYRPVDGDGVELKETNTV